MVILRHLSGGIEIGLKEIQTLTGHSGAIMCVRFHPNGTVLASCGGDKKSILWDVVRKLKGLYSSLAYSCVHFCSVHCIQETGAKIATLSHHKRYVTSCAFSRWGHLASVSNDRSLVLWDVSEIKGTGEPRINARPATASAAEEHIMEKSIQAHVGLSCTDSIMAHSDGVTGAKFIGDSLVATSGCDKLIKLWSHGRRTKNWALKQSVSTHCYAIVSMEIQRKKKLICTASNDGTVVVHSFEKTSLVS